MLCLLITRSTAQDFTLYVEPEEVHELEKTDIFDQIIGSNKNFFYVFVKNHYKSVTRDRVIAYSKTTLREVWSYEINEKRGVKHQLLDGPFVAYTKDGILVFTFSPYVNEEGLSMPTTLLDLNTGVAKPVENKFFIKRVSDKLLETPTMKLRLFSQDSSKMYVFTSNNVFGETGALTVTCIQMGGVKVLWSKPMKMGGVLTNMKFDNEDNLFVLATEVKEKRFDTYLCKYDFMAGKASGTLIKPDGNRKVNPDLYGRALTYAEANASYISEVNAVKMELTDKGEPLIAGFYEESSGKPGCLFQFYSKDLKKQSEKAEAFPSNVDAILSKEKYEKTDFCAQELLKIDNTIYMVGQQYNSSSNKTQRHNYVIVSLDESQKTNVSLLPPQNGHKVYNFTTPLNCFKYGGKMWVSYVSKEKGIEGFEGLDIMQRFKPAIMSTAKENSKNFFIKIGTNGIEDLKVVGIALKSDKGLSMEDRMKKSRKYNYDRPLPLISNGGKAIICITNFVPLITRIDGTITKYCFTTLDLK